MDVGARPKILALQLYEKKSEKITTVKKPMPKW